ncbi:MAG: hypothetical protein ACFB0E_16255 [Leptolyngbyaceae cyanobacterium]
MARSPPVVFFLEWRTGLVDERDAAAKSRSANVLTQSAAAVFSLSEARHR